MSLSTSNVSQRLTAVPSHVIGGCLLFLLYIALSRRKQDREDLPLPPGPRGKPIIKNLLDLPPEGHHLTVANWSRKYGSLVYFRAMYADSKIGDIIYINVAGQHLVYLNSFKAAVDLLEKRSSLYSDRAHTPMLELMGAGKLFGFNRYGDMWRIGRRIYHQEFNATASQKYIQIQLRYANSLVNLIKENPARFDKHLKYYSSGILLEVTYGFDVKPVNDPYVKIAENGMQFLRGLIPGTFLVDAFPLLKHVPEWIPGAQFQKNAKAWGKSMDDSCTLPFNEICKSFSEGTAAPSFTASWLSKINNEYPKEEIKQKMLHALKFSSGNAYIAGNETTSATLLNFVLLMINYPDVQRKAQEELDRVVGRERMPDTNDKLPYISALVREIMRYYPVGPLGVPHRLIADDIYNGMFLPKGSIVMGNAWAMSRDMSEYAPDPEVFRPERFLEGKPKDPFLYAFGFGRRICPGRYMVMNTVSIAITAILHVFSIKKKLDEDGKEIPFEPHWVNSIALHLKPFPASFELRFEGADKLIHVEN